MPDNPQAQTWGEFQHKINSREPTELDLLQLREPAKLQSLCQQHAAIAHALASVPTALPRTAGQEISRFIPPVC